MVMQQNLTFQKKLQKLQVAHKQLQEERKLALSQLHHDSEERAKTDEESAGKAMRTDAGRPTSHHGPAVGPERLPASFTSVKRSAAQMLQQGQHCQKQCTGGANASDASPLFQPAKLKTLGSMAYLSHDDVQGGNSAGNPTSNKQDLRTDQQLQARPRKGLASIGSAIEQLEFEKKKIGLNLGTSRDPESLTRGRGGSDSKTGHLKACAPEIRKLESSTGSEGISRSSDYVSSAVLLPAYQQDRNMATGFTPITRVLHLSGNQVGQAFTLNSGVTLSAASLLPFNINNMATPLVLPIVHIG
jgi:hypothetical protein